MASTESLINWFKARQGKVTYSRSSRMGPNSYDCSSAVYFALIEAGFLPKGTAIGNTESLFRLEGSLLKLISRSEAKRGDIFVSGKKGSSGGSNGHTGVFVSNNRIIHCTSGLNGIGETDAAGGWLGGPPTYCYRLPGSIDLSQYYTTNPGKVALLVNDNIYKSVEFNESTRGQLLAKNTLVDVQGINNSSAGYPRLRVSGGYLSANKAIVRKVVSNINDYYTTNPKKVALRKDDNCFNSVEFTESNRSTLLKKDTLLDVIDIDYSKEGYPRLKLTNGKYLSANKIVVLKVVDNINDYYTGTIKAVALLVEDCFYRDLEFAVRGETIAKNTIVPVSNIEFSSLGYPRLVTVKGYLTANRNLVRKVSDNINNYITTIPNQVRLLIDDYFYSSVEFLPENRSSSISVGTVVEVLDIDYASDGVPRLKTKQGYLTSNKNFVAVVS